MYWPVSEGCRSQGPLFFFSSATCKQPASSPRHRSQRKRDTAFLFIVQGGGPDTRTHSCPPTSLEIITIMARPRCVCGEQPEAGEGWTVSSMDAGSLDRRSRSIQQGLRPAGETYDGPVQTNVVGTVLTCTKKGNNTQQRCLRNIDVFMVKSRSSPQLLKRPLIP